MNRRNFLQNSSLAGFGLAASLSGCAENAAAEKTAETPKEFPLNETTISALQADMASGKFSSEKITQLYLDRIQAIDKAGPTLNAVIEINPDAIAIARSLDAERKAGKLRGPLHGIPILIKENIDTADKMQTTAGALALQGHIAKEDAFIVKKLREAGAVLLGKTNLSEWANFRSSSSSSGWSSRGGQTRMPYYLDHNPCGSSSGSGTAAAANLCVVAVGTETDGSITCPASVNNLVGIKPTVGLWSRAGIIPISSTQDTAGPLTRTVTDAAILLAAAAGTDANDPATSDADKNKKTDYLSYCKADGLKGKRIGVDIKKSKNQFIARLLEESIAVLKQQGAIIVEVDYLSKIDAIGGEELKVMQYEFKAGVNAYLAKAGHAMKSLTDVIAFNKANEDKAMPYFKQEQLEASDKKGDLNTPEYKEALAKSRDGSRAIIDAVMKEHQLDALAGITMGPGCAIDVIYGDRYSDDFLTAPAAMSGYPHISVPAGTVYNLPVGFSFFSGPYKEGELISMAFAFEQATKKRVAPQFIPSLPF